MAIRRGSRRGAFPAFLLWFLVLFAWTTPVCSAGTGAVQDLNIGLLKLRPKSDMQKDWQPLVDQLSRSLAGYRFRLHILDHQELLEAIRQKKVDFVLTNPAHYIFLRHNHEFSGALATLVPMEGSQPLDKFGGVIIARSERNDIAGLNDLRGRTIACVSVSSGSLGGYQMQIFEMKKADLPLPSPQQMLITGMPQDLVVQAVLDGRADIGFIRTGLMEKMAAQGKLNPARLKVINRKDLPGFPHACSTALYPEWPFISLPHIDHDLSCKVAAKLLELEHDAPYMKAAGIHGFSVPADYQPVEKLMRKLRVPPFDESPAVTLADIFERYTGETILASASMLLISLLALRLASANRAARSRTGELKAAKETWERTFNAMQDPIFIIDREYRIQQINRAAVDILGITAEQAIGMTCFSCMEGLGKPPDDCLQRKTLRDMQSHAAELTATRMGEHSIVTTTPIFDDQGDYLATVHVAHDISDIRRNEEELKKARSAADAANRAKSEFLANMSHEIRTPINGIFGMAQLMESTRLDSEQRDYVDVIKSSTNSLMSLINDILDLSKIEAGRIELEQRNFSLRETINDVCKSQLSLMHSKGIQLDLRIHEEIPDCLQGDQLRFKQILLNLLGNAVKFTDQGSITITADIPEQAGDSALFAITVTDTGIGIEPEALQRIFEPFSQADSSITRKYGGTGLGLSICTRLTELMGGTIQAESTMGVGSTFTIRIPFLVCKTAHAITRPDLMPEKDGTTPASLRILLAEDHPVNRMVVEKMLQKTGHFVVSVRNGAEALERTRLERFDLVLMDVRMPVMDGIEATLAIRLLEKNRETHLPIIALTAHAMQEEREIIGKAGFDGYVSKPVDLEILISEMGRCLNDTSSCPAPRHTEAAVKTAAGIKDVDVARVSRLLGETRTLLLTSNMAVTEKVAELSDFLTGLELFSTLCHHIHRFEFSAALDQLDTLIAELHQHTTGKELSDNGIQAADR